MSFVHAEGFAPVFDGESRLVILGSFPSVASRRINFYYGNPQNRFWRTVCGFFGEEVPADAAGKRAFLLRRHIALWDVVAACDIEGSSDASIRNVRLAEIPRLFENSPICAVFCNGGKAYSLFAEHFPQYLPLARKLSSTSPANPRFSAREWEEALCGVFPCEGVRRAAEN